MSLPSTPTAVIPYGDDVKLPEGEDTFWLYFIIYDQAPLFHCGFQVWSSSVKKWYRIDYHVCGYAKFANLEYQKELKRMFICKVQIEADKFATDFWMCDTTYNLLFHNCRVYCLGVINKLQNVEKVSDSKMKQFKTMYQDLITLDNTWWIATQVPVTAAVTNLYCYAVGLPQVFKIKTYQEFAQHDYGGKDFEED